MLSDFHKENKVNEPSSAFRTWWNGCVRYQEVDHRADARRIRPAQGVVTQDRWPGADQIAQPSAMKAVVAKTSTVSSRYVRRSFTQIGTSSVAEPAIERRGQARARRSRRNRPAADVAAEYGVSAYDRPQSADHRSGPLAGPVSS